MTMGEKIKTQRNYKGLTQKQLGDLTGIHEVAIRRYELDKVKPRPDHLEKIASALGTPMNTFLDFRIVTDADVMPLLFAIDEEFPLTITEIDGVPAVQFEHEYFHRFLRSWRAMKEMVEEGVMPLENYELWKDTIPGRVKPDFDDEESV